jgi:hypothetical protein
MGMSTTEISPADSNPVRKRPAPRTAEPKAYRMSHGIEVGTVIRRERNVVTRYCSMFRQNMVEFYQTPQARVPRSLKSLYKIL